MDHCDPRFRALLRPCDRRDGEQPDTVVYGLWPDLTLAGYNAAWVRFAEGNGGRDLLARFALGCYVPDAISRPLRRFYQSAYMRCLDEGRGWQHRYENSSVTEYRLMSMNVLPLAGSEGILVVNTCELSRPHDAVASPTDAARYLDVNGLFHQCSHCRRMQLARAPKVWDWVPAWVERSPVNTSHVICPACLDYHFPADEEEPALCSV
jgi:hypothetical protein